MPSIWNSVFLLLFSNWRFSATNHPRFQHLLDQAEGAIGVDPDLILDTVALCHDSHQAVLDRFTRTFKRAGHVMWWTKILIKLNFWYNSKCDIIETLAKKCPCRQQEHLRVTVSTWREEHFRCLRDDEFERSRSRVRTRVLTIEAIDEAC